MGWVKRYMSITTQQFTYYSKGGDSFPLGFMDTHDILMVKRIEKNGDRRFDVIANGQVLKLMAPDAKEADVWVRSIKAIVDAVKHTKIAVSKTQKVGNRRAVIPKWKKEFWKEDTEIEDYEGEKRIVFSRICHQSGAITSLYKSALKYPRLFKKLLTKYTDDVKMLQLIISVLLKEENEVQTAPVINLLSQEDVTTREGRLSIPSINSDMKRRLSNSRAEGVSLRMAGFAHSRIAKKKHQHRRSKTGYALKPPRRTPVQSNPKMSHSGTELNILFHDDGMNDSSTDVHNGDQKNYAPVKMWFYIDPQEQKPGIDLPSLKESIRVPEKIFLFKTYLKALYQDENIMFLCDAANFEQGKDEKGNMLSEEKLKEEAQRIYETYVKNDAEMDVNPTEKERRKARQRITSDNPKKAFVDMAKRIHALVEPQFEEYKESEFHELISKATGPIDERTLSQRIETGKVSDATLMWKDGTKISAWKEAGSIPVFRDAMYEKRNKGELSPDENLHIFNWIVNHDGALRMIAEGLIDESAMIRTLSYRALLLVIRATMGYDDADPSKIGGFIKDFVHDAKRANSESSSPINQVMEDHFCLMAIMFNQVGKFKSDFDGKNTSLKPGRQIYNYCIWQQVFTNLYGSNLYPRVKCLQDAYYHVVTNKTTALSLLTIPFWQAYMLPLAFDIPPDKNNSNVTKMKTYLTAMFVQLLWTCVEQGDFKRFALELRLTIAVILAICGESSGILVTEMLSSMASRFHTDSLKWIKKDVREQVKRYKCLQHLIRLLLSMGTGVSGRRFGLPDTLRTHKVLPKEFNERHHKQAPIAEKEGRKSQSDPDGPIRDNSNLGDFVDEEGSSKEGSRGERGGSLLAEPSQKHRPSITPNDNGIDICNDQQISYMLKVYYHSQENQSGGQQEVADTKKLFRSTSSSLNLNDYVARRRFSAIAGREDRYVDTGATFRLGEMRFVLNPGDIVSLFQRRLEELKHSIERYGDSDHISPDANCKNFIALNTFNAKWCQSLKGYIDALSKIQMLLLDLKQQDEKIAARPDTMEVVSDSSSKRARHEVLNHVSLVNDTIGFLDLMDKKLWKLLNRKQVRDLVQQFMISSNPIARRKIFHGWEKEKKKNQAKVTKELEKRLKEQEERRKNTYTLLLIGPGQSGKSTVFKQLTILHGKGFSLQAKKDFRMQIYANIVGAIKNLIHHANAAYSRKDESLADMADEVSSMHEILDYFKYNGHTEQAELVVKHIKMLNDITGLGQRYRSYLLEAATDDHKLKKALQVKKTVKEYKLRCEKFRQTTAPKFKEDFFGSFKISDDVSAELATLYDTPNGKHVNMNAKLVKALRRVWKEKAIRNIYRRRQRFKTRQLDDSAVYMLKNIDRILDTKEEFIPSGKDIVNCRQRTIGIVEGEFIINRQIFKVVDVAGQRGSRSRWIPLFSSANACLFVASLAGYNRYLLEEEEVGKLRIFEALELFEDIVNQRPLRKVPIILFLNKVDLFEKEIKTVSLRRAFPQYSGEGSDLKESVRFIEHRFRKCVKDPNRPLYIHTTCATDTQQVEKLVDSVTKIVVKQQLAAANLI